MELKNLTVSDFAAITASDAPAPGGGSVSALCGALAASLAEMVANLTSGREKYAQVQPQVEEVLQQYPAIRAVFWTPSTGTARPLTCIWRRWPCRKPPMRKRPPGSGPCRRA